MSARSDVKLEEQLPDGARHARDSAVGECPNELGKLFDSDASFESYRALNLIRDPHGEPRGRSDRKVHLSVRFRELEEGALEDFLAGQLFERLARVDDTDPRDGRLDHHGLSIPG